jgi:murein DD-endopeptidase MepM/ murein hydrolase activator NlpD
MDDRRLTLIIVPHGDLETRTFEISYSRLRFLAWTGAMGLVGLLVMVAAWFYLAARASKVEALENEISGFQEERAKVDSLTSLVLEIEGQYERVRQLLGADGSSAGQPPMLPKLGEKKPASGTVKSVIDLWPLGTTKGFITRGLTGDREANHPGIDIAVQMKTYIRAAGPGRVLEAGQDRIYGNYLVIDHGEGLQTVYGHAESLLVAKGDAVKRSQVIALSGNSGRSTAPHLHFEVKLNGKAVDPLSYVKRP